MHTITITITITMFIIVTITITGITTIMFAITITSMIIATTITVSITKGGSRRLLRNVVKMLQCCDVIMSRHEQFKQCGIVQHTTRYVASC